MAEEVNRAEYVLAPSELPCWWQEEYMAELHLELCQHMVRDGLQVASVPVRLTSHGRRCSHDHLPSQIESPSAGPRGAEVAKWLREDSSTK